VRERERKRERARERGREGLHTHIERREMALPHWLRTIGLGGVGCVLYCTYLLELIVTVVLPRAHRLFTPRYARRHRTAGVVYLALLVLGLVDAVLREFDGGQFEFHHEEEEQEVSTRPRASDWLHGRYWLLRTMLPPFASHLAFDVCLGVAGTILTLTAAYDFRVAHEERRVKNVASGALDADATVGLATFHRVIMQSTHQLMTGSTVHVTNPTHPGEWSDNPSRAYGRRHQLTTAGMVHVTAGMVHVTNLTPGSECNPTPR
jgi:hypothetical protein